jgi:hypothetical protein
MQFRFLGQVELIGSTGNCAIGALAGDMPVRCVVERSAIVDGFSELHVSDAEVLELFAARSRELELVASQRFFNGELAPVIKSHHMSH